MKTHMELKLRDHQGRTVLVRVEYDSTADSDYAALDYSVVAVGAHYRGKHACDAALTVSTVTEYKEAPLFTAIMSMTDALLDLSCNQVTGHGGRVNSNDHEMDCECHYCHHGVRV